MPTGRWTFEAITRHWNGANVVYFHKSEITEGFSVDISNGANAIGPDNLVVSHRKQCFCYSIAARLRIERRR